MLILHERSGPRSVSDLLLLFCVWLAALFCIYFIEFCRKRYTYLRPDTGADGDFFSTDSYFGIRSTPRVTAEARKRSRSFCQKCRWQVTAKHACTLRMRLCMKWHGAWLYGVHRTRRGGSSFTWHQPWQRCKFITSLDIQKRAIKKKLVIHVKSHASAGSVLGSGQ